LKRSVKLARRALAEQGVKLKSARRKAAGIVHVASPTEGAHAIATNAAVTAALPSDAGPLNEDAVFPTPRADDAIAPPEKALLQSAAPQEPSTFEAELRRSVVRGLKQLDAAIAAWDKKTAGERAALNSLYEEIRKLFASGHDRPEPVLMLLAQVTPVVEGQTFSQDTVRTIEQLVRKVDIGVGIHIRPGAANGIRLCMECGTDVTRWLTTLVYLADKEASRCDASTARAQ
jgi:hypothetical protein